MITLGSALGRFCQVKLSDESVFKGQFGKVKESLHNCIAICERWGQVQCFIA